MIEVTDKTIDEFISADKALILLSTTWCGRCATAMENMRTYEFETGIPCGWVNIQQNRKTLIKYFGRGIPEFLMFKNGKVIKRVRGTGNLKHAFGDVL